MTETTIDETRRHLSMAITKDIELPIIEAVSEEGSELRSYLLKHCRWHETYCGTEY